MKIQGYFESKADNQMQYLMITRKLNLKDKPFYLRIWKDYIIDRNNHDNHYIENGYILTVNGTENNEYFEEKYNDVNEVANAASLIIVGHSCPTFKK